jgi:hypothetical protein
MSYYELTTLQTVMGGAAKGAAAIEDWINAGAGTLHGAWFSDIGSLNEAYLLRGFQNAEAMLWERERLIRSDNPFGCMDLITGYTAESYRALDFMGAPEHGELGPVYEIRSYNMKLNGLLPTMEKWQAALPERNRYSKCAIAMYGIDMQPRLTQIWPYASLEARTTARGQSVADGHWPPAGGPAWLSREMRSTIALPLPFSPMA